MSLFGSTPWESLRYAQGDISNFNNSHAFFPPFMTLFSYLLRRLVGFAAVMVGISIITFSLSHIVPGDPAVVALGDHATEAQIDAFREKNGLNKPVPEQYWIYVSGLLRGDLGISLR
ncbi:MAG TPA: hypothetical protein VFI76_07605, partial [Terrimicrobiaceae bacterium]|nr:hypothetical protein [Terrimicrobiaceae bacterium]